MRLILGVPSAREPPDAHLPRHRVAVPLLPHLEDHPQRLRDGDRPREGGARLDGVHPTGVARPHRPQLLRQLPHLRFALKEGGEERGMQIKAVGRWRAHNAFKSDFIGDELMSNLRRIRIYGT